MNFRKIGWSRIITVLLLLFVAAYIYSARVKSWVIRAKLMVGFYKPHIPENKLGPAPVLVLQNSKGNVVNIRQFKGKVVFVNFWAVWCPPCLAELPSVDNLHSKFKADTNIVFITVDIDNNLPRAAKMLEHRGYDLPVYGTPANKPVGQFAPDGIPTTLVIDKEGNLAFQESNTANYNDEKFAAFMERLAKK